MTGLKEHSSTIDGITYKTTVLPATDGLKIMPKLVSLLGETGMSLLMATTEEDKEKLMQRPEIVSALISTIAERAADDDGLLVLRELMRYTSCDAIEIGDRIWLDRDGSGGSDQGNNAV